MTGRKFLLFIFFLIIASFYSHAQFYGKKDTAGKNNSAVTDPFPKNKTVQNLYSSEEAETDTIYPSFIKEDFIVNNFEGEYGADQIKAAAAIDGKGNVVDLGDATINSCHATKSY